MSAVTTEKLGRTVGAEIVGVDCDRLLHDDAFPAECLQALEENGALGVPRPAHRRRDAGGVQPEARQGRGVRQRRVAGDLPGHARPGQEPRGRVPPRARSTGTSTVPPTTSPSWPRCSARTRCAASGGETEFTSTYAAYDDLSDEEKERYLQLRVVHTFEASQRLVNPDPSEKELAMWRARPAKTHPLVWRHRSGRRSLVLGATASHVDGMDVEEGRALLAELLAWSTSPDRVFRHEWSVGDMVIWDNRGVLHRACRYDASSPRDMHRTTIAGDEPIQ